MAKILIVDDEPSLVATLDDNLRRDGHEVAIARDGEAALEQARRTGPDPVVLDVMLPKLDGIEVCRALRRTSTVRSRYRPRGTPSWTRCSGSRSARAGRPDRLRGVLTT
jgi:CheY-like chemotaxis protein